MSEELLHNEVGLLLLVSEGDETAFRQLFNTYRKKLYTYVLKITHSTEMAEEAVQEIFLKVWEKRKNLTAVENINAYLHRMAHNITYDGFKQIAKEKLVLSTLQIVENTGSLHDPSEKLISKEVQAYINSIVDQLTPQQRKVYILSREQGLRHEEIAMELNISVTAVKKHIGDALRSMRTAILQNYGAGAVAILVIYQLALY